jgi:hypothetical protein
VGGYIVADADTSVPTSTTRRATDGVPNATDTSIVLALAFRPAVPTLVWSADIVERFVSEPRTARPIVAC